MAPRIIRILFVGCLILAMSPRQVFGLSCCHRQSHADQAADAVPNCACKHCSQPDEDAVAVTESTSCPDSPKPCPCSPNGVEWCCGVGYVPLTLPIFTTPILELTPELALSYLHCQPADGVRPRIEEPPRSHV